MKRQMEKTQREYYLNEQMKAIQRELGEQDDARDELIELEKRIKKTKLSKEARTKAEARAEEAAQHEPDVGGIHRRAQLPRLAAVDPVGQGQDQADRPRRRPSDILEEDHYGLEKVKERILEYLAVQARTGSLKGPILCLVGPPGVGKTSLGRSIAKATGREFVRLSPRRRARRGRDPRPPPHLHRLDARQDHPVDEEGQDHQHLLPAGRDRQDGRRLARRPVVSALLEVLDPEQNSTFNDHYLEVDYDLSKVMFVTTANSLNMPQPLLDRMEIIRIPGYTEDEKVEIAKRHLLPKLAKDHGLKDGEWIVPGRGHPRPDPLLHPRSRRAVAGAGAGQPGAQGGARPGAREAARRSPSTTSGWPSTPACASTATARPTRRIRSASSPAWPGPSSAATS